MAIVVRSRNGAIPHGRFGARARDDAAFGGQVVTAAFDFQIVIQPSGSYAVVLRVDVTPVASADAYGVILSAGTTPLSMGYGGADGVVVLEALSTNVSLNRDIAVFAISATHAGPAMLFTVTQDPDDAPAPVDEPIVVTDPPVLTFNGGPNVGATFTSTQPVFTGGPLTAPMTANVHTSTDAFAANNVDQAPYLGAHTVGAWAGLRLRVEWSLTDAVGTVISVSAASAVIASNPVLPVPPALLDDDWAVSYVRGPAADQHYYTFQVIDPAIIAVEADWLDIDILNFQDPADYESLWAPCLLGNGVWANRNAADTAYHIRADASTPGSQLRMRYKTNVAGPWSLASITQKTGPLVAVVIPDLPVPATPVATDWAVTARPALAPNATTHHVYQYQWLGAGVPVVMDWANTAVDPPLEASWKPCLLENGFWSHRTLANDLYQERLNGAAPPTSLRLRYKLDLTGPFSLASIDGKVGPFVPATPVVPATDGWHSVALITDQEAAVGGRGGSAEQHLNLTVRSRSNPSVIMAALDVHGVWRSEDDGQTMFQPACEGLYAYFCCAFAMDPADDKVVLFGGTNQFRDEAISKIGLYRSADAGKKFAFTQYLPELDMRKCRAQFFDWDRSLTATQTPTNRTWYALLQMGDYTRAELWKSTTGGQSGGWAKVRDLTLATYSRVNGIWHHPTLTNTLFIATDNGLYRTTDGGVTLSKMTVAGYLTANKVMSVEINPAGGALASTELYFTISDTADAITGACGVWHSTTGGTTNAKLTGVPGKPAHMVVAPQAGGGWAAEASRKMFLVSRNSSFRRTLNGGTSWSTVQVILRPNPYSSIGAIQDPNQNGINPQAVTCILPHPTNPNVVFASSLAKFWRATDGGAVFKASGDEYEGQSLNQCLSGLAFDEGTGANAYLNIDCGVTDKGLWTSKNGCSSFHFTPISATVAGAVLKRSCNAVTKCPDFPDVRIVASGHTALSAAYYFWSNTPQPREQQDGHWTTLSQIQAGWPNYAHWHRSDNSICYLDRAKRTNARISPVSTSYGTGFNGYVCEVYPGNNDILYSWFDSTKTLIFSIDRGASWSTFKAVGWGPYDDSRKAIIRSHSSDPNIVWMPHQGSGTPVAPTTGVLNKDLARYNKTTNTWKVDFGLPARFRADNPSFPANMPVKVYDIGVDQLDPNTVAVSIDAIGSCAIYITYNAMATTPVWENITKNIPRLDGAFLRFHPWTRDMFCYFGGHGAMMVHPPKVAGPKPSLASKFPVK